MLFCNLRILFIRQRNEGICVAQHVCIVLLYNAISEYHVAVAVATAVKTLDAVLYCNSLIICIIHTIVVFF